MDAETGLSYFTLQAPITEIERILGAFFGRVEAWIISSSSSPRPSPGSPPPSHHVDYDKLWEACRVTKEDLVEFVYSKVRRHVAKQFFDVRDRNISLQTGSVRLVRFGIAIFLDLK